MALLAETKLALRENLWEIRPDEDCSYVETSDGVFEVNTASAMQFLRVRSHCTGHNSVDVIAARSGMDIDDVLDLVEAVETIGMRARQAAIEVEARPARLQRIVEMWASELKRCFIGNRLLSPNAKKQLLAGWLLETYHYVRDFPAAIAFAAERAENPQLRALLVRYAGEERGHERYVLQSLTRLGFSADEVRNSSPLVSTQLIAYKMRDLFAVEPSAVLLMAAMVEAQEFDHRDIASLQREIEVQHSIPEGALAPYFEHQRVDYELGHHHLLEENLELLNVAHDRVADRMINALHDLKHAFDLQSMEIELYYGGTDGQFIPRQPVTMASL
jgi:pyrroloquinoline quinone (PQQ) biosynthesis protein C